MYKFKLKENKYGPKGFEVGDVKVKDGTQSTVTKVNPVTGAISWDVANVGAFDTVYKTFDELNQLVKTLESEGEAESDPVIDSIADNVKKLFNQYRTHIRKTYPESWERVKLVRESNQSEWDAIDVSRTAEKELSNKEWNERTAKKLAILKALNDEGKFKKDWDDDHNTTVISDHRIHQYGGQFACSMKDEWMWKHVDTGELKTAEEIDSTSASDYNQINIGFEKTLNKILNLISSKKWQDEYEGGYFLFLFKSAIQRQIIEISFISCWTIWEHIFAIKNRNWLDNKTIERMNGDKKIAFILKEYFLKSINDSARENIQKINKTRNRLIHFGKKTERSTL